MPRSVEGTGGDGPWRKEAKADGKGAVDAAAAEEEADAAEEVEAGRRPRLLKMTRGRGCRERWCRGQ